MKKTISALFLCGTLLTSGFAVMAEEPVLISAPASAAVTVEGEAVSGLYQSGGHWMVPLRQTAEKLGFTVTWNGADGTIDLDNKVVNTRITLGEDQYYMASSFAIGMSAPGPLGAAPELKDDLTYVPVELFALLQCGYVNENGTVSLTKEASTVQIPNPFTEYETVAEAQKALSFQAAVPSYVPAGYELSSVSVMSNDFLQLMYQKGEQEITYRTAKGTDDVSGDYNVYQNVKTVQVGTVQVTLREGEESSGAIWTDGTNTFSLFARPGISGDDLLKIMKSL